MAAAAQDLIEQLVSQWLLEADMAFLVARCTEFNIEVPPERADSRQHHLKLVSRHLNSEALEQSPDQGKAIWFKMFSDLGAALGKGAVKTEEQPSTASSVDSVTNVGSAPSDAAGSAGAGTLTFHKLRDFKISGVVDEGKEGTLQYVSLQSQIKLGVASKYTTPEIIYGVIKACPTSSNFRTLLESNVDMSMADFTQLLRTHYKEQDSEAVLEQLRDCYQLGNSAHDYCCKVFSLRDRLRDAAVEEGNPWSEARLRTRAMTTISTGLKGTASGIKLELQPYLSDSCTLGDWDFLEKVTLAEIHEKERLKKVKAKEAELKSLTLKSDGKKSNPASQSSAPAKPDTKSKNCSEDTKMMAAVNILTAKIDSLAETATAQDARMKSLEKTLLNGQVAHVPGFKQNNNNNFQRHGTFVPSSRPIFKCQACASTGVGFCSHCFKCGEDGHRKNECPN